MYICRYIICVSDVMHVMDWTALHLCIHLCLSVTVTDLYKFRRLRSQTSTHNQ